MFVAPAFAQGASADGGGGGLLVQLMPLVLIFAVFYFLLIRPQQKRLKAHKAMVAAVERGDSVVTAGGVEGRVVRVEAEGRMVSVEIAPDVRIRVVRDTLSEVTKPAGKETKPGGDETKPGGKEGRAPAPSASKTS